jgi:hypothetical protein
VIQWSEGMRVTAEAKELQPGERGNLSNRLVFMGAA